MAHSVMGHPVLLLLAISRAYRGIIYLLSGEMEKLFEQRDEMNWKKKYWKGFDLVVTKNLCFFIDWTGAEFVFLLHELENQWWTFLVIMNPLTKIFTPRKIKSYSMRGLWLKSTAEVWRKKNLKRQKLLYR